MRRIWLIAGLALASGGAAGAVTQAPPSLPYHPMIATGPGPIVTQVGADRAPPPRAQRWDGAQWDGGNRSQAYRRPSRGWIVPAYWTAPNFIVGNFADYGLAPPPAGYAWSRYYDDAVLIDREGRVYDWVERIGWDAPRPAPQPLPQPGPQRYAYDYDGVTLGGHIYNGTWEGTWTGSYDGAPPERYQGRFDGGYDGPVPGAGYDEPPPPAFVQPAYPPQPVYGGPAYPAPGYGGSYVYTGGWYYPAPTVTTVVIQSQPVVTTTTRVEEYVVARPVMRAKPKAIRRPRCRC